MSVHPSKNALAPAVVHGISPSALYASEFLTNVLPTWSDMPEWRLRDLGSAVRCMSRALNIPIENLKLNCATINLALKRGSLRYKALHPNQRSGVRFILRRLGEHRPHSSKSGEVSPEWLRVLGLLGENHRRFALIGIARFCSGLGIEPGNLTSDVIKRFELDCTTTQLCPDPADRARRAVATWRWAHKTIEGWPDVELTREGMREPYTYPLAAYPALFQADVELFARRQSCEDLDDIFPDDLDLGRTASFDETGHRRGKRSQRGRQGPARPATVRTRQFQILQAGAALVRSGRDVETILSLADLVGSVSTVRTITGFFWDRAGRKPNGQVHGILEVLRQLALYHCKADQRIVETIATVQRRVAPPRQHSMTAKNSERLRALADRTNRAMLLHLPAKLMERVSSGDYPPHVVALLAMSAAAIEIMLVCPFRLDNLRTLSIEKSLLRLGSCRRHITHLYVPTADVKNKQPIHWPLPASSAALIERYIKEFRPILAAAGNQYLFPGTGLKPRSTSGMRSRLVDPVAQMIGVIINPHLLRHYAAWSFLKKHPGQYETVRRVLGHKDMKTTIAYYTGLEAEFAAIHFDACVLADKQALKAVAAAAFKKRPGFKLTSRVEK